MVEITGLCCSDEAVDKKGVVLSEWYLGEGWEQKLDLPLPGEL